MSDATASSGPPRNAITWTEIPCEDFEPMIAFYKSVFDWNIAALPEDPHVPYVMFDKGPCHGTFIKVPGGSILSPATQSAKTAAVRVTITVVSVDETLEKIAKAGGKVYETKSLLPNDMGAVAHFLDPAKNVMGLWSEK